jgi:ribosomal protein L21
VLAVKEGGKLHVGQPWMEKVTVEAEVIQELKGDKVRAGNSSRCLLEGLKRHGALRVDKHCV